jgi:hypothetical protein
METKIEIKTLFGLVLFEFEKENNSIKDTLSEAVKNRADLRDPLTPVVKYTGKRAGKYPINKYNHICYNCPKFDDDVAVKKGLPLCSPTLNPCKKLKEYL